jgi:hypothetical protein
MGEVTYHWHCFSLPHPQYGSNQPTHETHNEVQTETIRQNDMSKVGFDPSVSSGVSRLAFVLPQYSQA